VSELTIAAVLEYYGADMTRVRQGGWRPVKCPWHADRVASASVNLEKGAFRCHACDMKGDAIAIIKRIEGLGYGDALNFAREVLGASVQDVSRSTEKPKRKRPTASERLFD
jgi:DNA primase